MGQSLARLYRESAEKDEPLLNLDTAVCKGQGSRDQSREVCQIQESGRTKGESNSCLVEKHGHSSNILLLLCAQSSLGEKSY